MNTYRIGVYLQPWELDGFLRQVYSFISASYFLNKNETNIIFDITLNVSNQLIDWEKSRLSVDFFLKKFDYIVTLLGKYYKVEFDTDESIQGCSDKRRSIHYKKQDFIIWLDPDVVFNYSVFVVLILTPKMLLEKGEKMFILTPQIYKSWDDSWDCIVAKQYRSEDIGRRHLFDTFVLSLLQPPQNINILKLKPPKFGGGWLTLFTQTLFDKYPIPEELKSYGYEDFYYQCLGSYIEIPQFVLEDCIVNELSDTLTEKCFYEKEFLHILKQNRKKDISPEEYRNIFIKKLQEYKKIG